ncbi:MAG: hypothetical protein M3209_09825 [Acidobacteriota bacterium]|nr:hypothetical protein [Acidobacteriota bacterium]
MAFVRTFTASGGRNYQALVQSVWDKQKKQPRQRVVRWLGRVRDSIRWQVTNDGTVSPVETAECITRSFRSSEEKFVCSAIGRNRSLLVHGS